MAYCGKPSDACYTCRKKRGKCDRRKPGCGQCARKRIPCLGYRDPLAVVFRDQTTATVKRANATSEKKSKQAGPSHRTTSRPDGSFRLLPSPPPGRVRLKGSLPPAATTAITTTGLKVTRGHEGTLFGSTAPAPPSQKPYSVINFDTSPQINGCLYSPHLTQEQMLSIFCSAISPSGPVLVFSRQTPSHTRWLCQLPSLFYNKLLDNAVRAVSLVHLSRVHQLAYLRQESRRYYGNSLRLLSDALSDDVRCISTETLSATILLSFYEMFVSGSCQSWVRHAGGASTIMRIRGPSKHLSGLGRDIYLAYRHTIYIEALVRVEPCFLSEPEWTKLAKQVHKDLRFSDLVDPKHVELFDLIEEFYMENIHIPRVCYDALRVSRERQVLTVDEFQVHRVSIVARCRDHRLRLQSINLRLRAAIQQLNLDDITIFRSFDPVFPMQYSYISESIARIHLAHFSMIIILNRILNDFESMGASNQKESSYLSENREAARDICRTTSFMLASSVFGPFFLTFALQLCLVALESGEERAWVERKLLEIENPHMTIVTDAPGRVQRNELALNDPS